MKKSHPEQLYRLPTAQRARLFGGQDHHRTDGCQSAARPSVYQQVLQRHRLQLSQRCQLRRHEVLQVTKVTCANVFRGGIINQC